MCVLQRLGDRRGAGAGPTVLTPGPRQRHGGKPDSAESPRQGRWLRRAGRLGTALVVVFALIGVLTTWNFVAGAPGVGHFRSAEGREDYATAYAVAMDLLPDPSAVHDVQTSHGSVRVYEWATEQNRGQTPVLLVPGRATGVPMWVENLPALVRERRVLAFDALGDSGFSEQSVPFASFADQALPVDDVVRKLAPKGVHLVGHSLGGAVAAAYARQYPDRTVTLTLLEPAFTFAPPPPGLLWWAMVASLPVLPEGVRESALEKVGGVDMTSSAFQDDPMARMIGAASEHYAAALPTPSPLTDAQLAQLTVPVYVAIASEDSLAGGPSAVDRAGRLPRSVVQTWPDTTHSLPMQASGELEPVLLQFFSEHERP